MSYTTILASLWERMDALMQARKEYHDILRAHDMRPESFLYLLDGHESFKTSCVMKNNSAHDIMRVIEKEHIIELIGQDIKLLSARLQDECSKFPIFKHSRAPRIAFMFNPNFDGSKDSVSFNFLPEWEKISTQSSFTSIRHRFFPFSLNVVEKILNNLALLEENAACFEEDKTSMHTSHRTWKIGSTMNDSSNFCMVCAHDPKDALLYAISCGHASFMNKTDGVNISLSKKSIEEILVDF